MYIHNVYIYIYINKMQLTPPDTERKKKMEEIQKIIPKPNYSKEFYEWVVDKMHLELYGENELDKLKVLSQEADKKIEEANKKVKEAVKEKEIILEKLKKVEEEEPILNRIKEEREKLKLEDYEKRFESLIEIVLGKFEIDEEAAKILVKEYLTFYDKKMPIDEFMIKNHYKLNSRLLSYLKNNLDEKNEYIYKGYKFD